MSLNMPQNKYVKQLLTRVRSKCQERVNFAACYIYIYIYIYHHHPVPFFIALAIMSFHIPRSLVAFRISTTLPAPSQLTSPSVIFSRCLPLLRFPSIIPVVMRCSNFFPSHYMTKECCLSCPNFVYKCSRCVGFFQYCVI